MTKTNKDVYPITAAFEEQFENFMPTQELHSVFETMAGNLGEYEGGHADVDDAFGDDNPLVKMYRDARKYERADDRPIYRDLVQQYADVCADILRALASVAVDFETIRLDDRKKSLREGDALREEDVVQLFRQYFSGKYYVGEDAVVTMKDFGEWLSGTGSFVGNEPAEVTW